MKKICVIIGSRANYSSFKSALAQIKKHPKLKLFIIASYSSLVEKFGNVVDLIEKDKFKINKKIENLISNESISGMVKTTGLGMIELATTFEEIKPDIVITIGDRYETMATAVAASYMNIHLAHTMGGEVSGTIDESVRHAITKLSNIHFPASEDAKKRIINLGEDPKYVFNIGCPRVDLVKEVLLSKKDYTDGLNLGIGSRLDTNNNFLLVSQHPVTTENLKSDIQIRETLKAIEYFNLPTILIWPNADAGSNSIAKEIRQWRENNKLKNVHLYKNLPINTYITLLNKTSCLIGNSSSGIRESGFIGTPVVNIGTRQTNRERGKNVLDSNYDHLEIVKCVKYQLKHGKYKPNYIYGDGNSGIKITKILSKINLTKLNIQKRITY